jgi:hypothetical protein
MKKQLEPALAAMRGEGLLSRSGWTKGRYGDTMLQLEKGSKMRISSKTTLHSDSEPSFETTSTESLNPVTPSDRIISEYYRRRFSISNHRINANERSFIVHLMDIHGLESLERVLAKVASRMRREYPAGQTIAAAESFFEQELAALTSRPQDRSKQSETPSPPTESKQDRRVRQQAIWDSLSEDEKANLHNLVRKRLPKSGSESTGYQIMLLNEASKLRDLSL